MNDDRELGLEPVDEAQDLPRVIEEAHEVLQSYGWQILGLGTFAAGVWGALMLLEVFVPLQWLLVVLLALLGLYYFPVSREPRLADHRRDEREVERLLSRAEQE